MRRGRLAAGSRPRLVITGLGIISSLGARAKVVWQSAISGQAGITTKTFRLSNGKRHTFFLHRAQDDKIENLGIKSETLQLIDSWKNGRVDEDLLWAIAAGQRAVQDSQLLYNPADNNVSLFVTHENPGLEVFFDGVLRSAYDLLSNSALPKDSIGEQRFIEKMYRRCVNDGYDAQTFMYLYLVSKALGVHGHTSFNCNACASGLYALEQAARELTLGSSAAAIVIASDRPKYPYKFLWFEDQKLYAPDGLTRPFDRNRGGFSIGEGAAAIVLEPYERAKARKAKIYAEYLGGGFGAQGWKVTVPDLSSPVYSKTMTDALQRANLCPKDIDMINGHGVGTIVGDAYEARAIQRVFGPPELQPPVTAFKPYFGHTLGGCALVELVLVILSMQHQTILPILNVEQPDPALPIAIAKRLQQKRLQRVMKCASGFAGYDASIILGRVAI